MSHGEGATVDSARALIDAGRFVDALHEISELQKDSSEDPQVQFEIGRLLQELANLRAENLKRLAPDSPQVHEITGKTLEAHGKLPEALREYDLAVKVDPVQPGLHFLIGNLHWKQHEYSAAIPELKEELRLNPHHALANLRLGQISLSTDPGSPQKAIAYLQQAVADKHTGLIAHRELGKALRLAGRYQDALKELNLVAAQNPEDELVHGQLAAVYKAQGNKEATAQQLLLQRSILDRKRQASLDLRNELDH